jgi:hypothetical protein
VQRIERTEIVLEQGRVPTDDRTIHIHCAARGLASPPLRPIFEPGRVTVQACFWGFTCYQFATLGVVEATLESDEEKNRMCPPIAYWDVNQDYLTAYLARMALSLAIGAHPKLAAWNKASRLNPIGEIDSYRDDPSVIASRERIKRFAAAAAMNAQRLLSQRNQSRVPIER